MSLLLGAIADDFTSATDLANTLVKAGMNTVPLIGVPDAASTRATPIAEGVELPEDSNGVGERVTREPPRKRAARSAPQCQHRHGERVTREPPRKRAGRAQA